MMCMESKDSRFQGSVMHLAFYVNKTVGVGSMVNVRILQGDVTE